jgi:GTP cyclohydrolase I
MHKLEDTQNEADQRNVPIHRVGIRELKFPLRFRDSDGSAQATVAEIGMSVSLPASVRGTHMSRFVSILSEHAEEISVASMPGLMGIVNEQLEADGSTVTFDFPFFVTKEAPVSKLPGKIDYGVHIDTMSEHGEVTTTLSLEVPVTTLCPCSRNISDRGAHNQRGVVTVTLEGPKLPSLKSLIKLVEDCGSADLYSVLKRPDEKFVTERAYDRPVFVEDLVRNVAVRLKKLKGVSSFQIEGENFESIHNHNAFAVVIEDTPE